MIAREGREGMLDAGAGCLLVLLARSPAPELLVYLAVTVAVAVAVAVAFLPFFRHPVGSDRPSFLVL